MTPAALATRQAPLARPSAPSRPAQFPRPTQTPRPVQTEREAAQGRPDLRVVARRRRAPRMWLAPAVAGALVAGSLLAVVVGHAELAQGQVRLASINASVTAAQTAHHKEALSVANLENPSRIVSAAENELHMVPASQVQQVPHVSLSAPLPALKVDSTATPGQ